MDAFCDNFCHRFASRSRLRGGTEGSAPPPNGRPKSRKMRSAPQDAVLGGAIQTPDSDTPTTRAAPTRLSESRLSESPVRQSSLQNLCNSEDQFFELAGWCTPGARVERHGRQGVARGARLSPPRSMRLQAHSPLRRHGPQEGRQRPRRRAFPQRPRRPAKPASGHWSHAGAKMTRPHRVRTASGRKRAGGAARCTGTTGTRVNEIATKPNGRVTMRHDMAIQCQ